ncbi:alpha/beta fold hydrolase [Nocardioides sp. LHG3406-4]|uniref:alpha/beta fold hydrolase n=1 Tax=Nocardioides sp. LHG3406-4 TaxID=2804575 RepID=UPI003CF27EC7
MTSAPIILVPGYWLGAWAWDEVAAALRADGHGATALTLPGLGSADADRSSITFADHVDAVCAAVHAAGAPVVLAVHSGAGAVGYAVSDRVPDQLAHVVYVDTGPAIGPLDADLAPDELPMPPLEVLGPAESLAGLTDEQLATFRDRAVPQPGGVVRGSAELVDDRRLDVPTTVVCTTIPVDHLQSGIADGQPWVGGLAQLRHVALVDLPTSHWPMWSRPADLAAVLSEIARGDVS